MQVKCLTLCTPDLLGVGKMSDIEISDLIGFGYDLSDTQYGLRCWSNEIYILW